MSLVVDTWIMFASLALHVNQVGLLLLLVLEQEMLMLPFVKIVTIVIARLPKIV